MKVPVPYSKFELLYREYNCLAVICAVTLIWSSPSPIRDTWCVRMSGMCATGEALQCPAASSQGARVTIEAV